jgi:hypothetical protein|tara:strand:- start:977 stop:1372 length:396 start_codon:yes stop_codon:yes gene_type:complete
MQKNDLKYRLKQIIREEVTSMLQEDSYKFGTLADPKKMDPNDPMVKVDGFASMNRSSIRTQIVDRLSGALSTAKDAARGGDESYQAYKQLQDLISDAGILYKLIGAELDVANALEATRLKGGRRTIPIPEQ